MNWYDRVQQREADFYSVYERMDTDRDLYFLKAFHFLDDAGNKIEDLEELTDNGPGVFVDQVKSTLGGATIQTVVSGKNMKEEECTYIEKFLDDIYLAVDEGLVSREITSLNSFIVEQAVMRGRLEARCTLHIGDDGQLVIDVLPCDSRFVAFEHSTSGYAWKSYKTMRYKDMIISEYPDIDADRLHGDGKIEVLDIYTEDENVIYIDSVEAKVQPHDYGEVPSVSAVVGAGTSFQDEEAFAHVGESVLWRNRDLYPEFNKMASILHSLNVAAFFGGMQYESDDGAGAHKPERPPWGKRFVVPVEKGGGYKAMPLQDVKNATRMLFGMLSASIQRGSLSNVEYGNLSFPLSAVAITKLAANRDKIYLPRIQALTQFYQRLSLMILKQYIQLGIDTELGERGFRETYPASKLDGDYNIKFKFFANTPEQNIANLQIASAARSFVSGDYIRREIISMQDPDGDQRKMRSEIADVTNPILALYDMCVAKIEEGDDLKAKALKNDLMVMLRQKQGGMVPQLTEGRGNAGDGQQQGEELMPLIGDQRGGGRRRQKAPEDELPEEPEEEE